MLPFSMMIESMSDGPMADGLIGSLGR